jgi:high-affinity iron transporter
VLEATLITAIILSYLARSRRPQLSRYVWYGIVLAVVASVSVGVGIWVVFGEIPEVYEALFEAVAAFVAVAVLSSMIYWMAVKGRTIRQEVERRVDAIASRGAVVGLVSLGFVVVFREGFETVLFLMPFLVSDAVATLAGMLLGILTAVLLSYGIFVVGMRINLQRFFHFTSILLILLAGGLAGYGTHELLEYSEGAGVQLGWLAQPAYSLGIPDSSPFHDKGVVGSVFAVMFGYTVSAEWLRVIVHVSYLAVVLPLVVWVYRRTRNQNV